MMHVRRIACLSALIVGTLSSLASAQGREPAIVATKDADAAQFALDDHAACLVRHDRKDVTAFLAAPVGKARRPSAGACPEPAVSAPVELMRGALYRTMYRERFAMGAPALSDKPVEYAADLGGAPLQGEAAQYVAQRQFGECVVRADASSSRAVTLADAGSPQARASLAALRPTLGGCLPQGSNVSISKQMLAGLIGESLYRLSDPSLSSAGSR